MWKGKAVGFFFLAFHIPKPLIIIKTTTKKMKIILAYTELIFNADKVLAIPTTPFIVSYNHNSIKKQRHVGSIAM